MQVATVFVFVHVVYTHYDESRAYFVSVPSRLTQILYYYFYNYNHLYKIINVRPCVRNGRSVVISGNNSKLEPLLGVLKRREA